MDKSVSLLHAGEGAKMLDYYIEQMARCGVAKHQLCRDIFDTLTVKQEFSSEVNYLYSESLYGEYFSYKVSQFHQDTEVTTSMLEDFALTAKRVACDLHHVLVSRGLYGNDGTLPYEYLDYKNNMFYLSGLK